MLAAIAEHALTPQATSSSGVGTYLSATLVTCLPCSVASHGAWFATNANAGVVMRKLLAFQVDPSWSKLPGLMAAAMKG